MQVTHLNKYTNNKLSSSITIFTLPTLFIFFVYHLKLESRVQSLVQAPVQNSVPILYYANCLTMLQSRSVSSFLGGDGILFVTTNRAWKISKLPDLYCEPNSFHPLDISFQTHRCFDSIHRFFHQRKKQNPSKLLYTRSI